MPVGPRPTMATSKSMGCLSELAVVKRWVCARLVARGNHGLGALWITTHDARRRTSSGHRSRTVVGARPGGVAAFPCMRRCDGYHSTIKFLTSEVNAES